MNEEKIRKIADHYRWLCTGVGHGAPALPPLPEGGEMAPACVAALEAGAEHYDVVDYYEAFWLVQRSDFLKGGGKRGWKPDYLWLITPENLQKVLSNKYTPQLDFYDRLEMRSISKLMMEE